jgi:uncharacterized membrane protein YgaE (UPF0421/DUF939 family)
MFCTSPTRRDRLTRHPDSEKTCLCACSLSLWASWRICKYRFDSIDNWTHVFLYISVTTIHIKKERWKTYTDSLPFKKTTYYKKKMKNHVHSTIELSMIITLMKMFLKTIRENSTIWYANKTRIEELLILIRTNNTCWISNKTVQR